MRFSFKRSGKTLTFVALIAAIAGSSTLAVRAQQSQTVTQGVYTQQQAVRGQTIYMERCSSCHSESLAGGLGPPLTGDDFIQYWGKEPLSELANKIKATMPQKEPGTLTGQQTADIVAYMLQTGKLSPGRIELSADEAVLKQITWPAGNAAPAKPPLSAGQISSFPPAGNLTQVMRGILFPSSNIVFTAQTVDPGAPRVVPEGADRVSGFNWVIWSSDIYTGWEFIDYAAVSLAESAPLMLTPGRRCENGKPVPIDDPDWIKFTMELAEAGKAVYKASQTRNQETVSDASNQLNDACFNCHEVYRDHPERVMRAEDPSNKAARCTK